MKKTGVMSLLLCLMMVITSLNIVVVSAETPQIKNAIFLIPDGGGMVPFYLADYLKQAGGMDKTKFPNATEITTGPMYLKDYLVAGHDTRRLDGEYTDSAQAGTAMSSGYRTANTYIGVDINKVPKANILEASQKLGKRTGIVATIEFTNATPAAFSSHASARSDNAAIAEQMVNQEIDVLLARGWRGVTWGSIDEVKKRGYSVPSTLSDLSDVEFGDKLWGDFDTKNIDYLYNATTPDISEMTAAAIKALAGDKGDESDEGFFLMVEGSYVDHHGHSNNAHYMASEFMAFDKACQVAIEFAKGRDDTVVVVAPDHDTGGMILPTSQDDLTSAIEQIKIGKNPAEVTWESGDHTTRDGGVFIYKPDGVDYPEGITMPVASGKDPFEENKINNYDMPNWIADLFGTDFAETSAELFVDVTNQGSYDKDTELFTFTESGVITKRNASYAFVGDKIVDLDGQVTVYVNNKFYVPQLLLDIIDEEVTPEVYPYNGIVSPVTSSFAVEPSDDKWKGKITVTNMLPEKDFKGTLKFTAPATFTTLDPIAISVEGGKSKLFMIDECPLFDSSNEDLVFEYTIETQDAKYEFSSPLTVNNGYSYWLNDGGMNVTIGNNETANFTSVIVPVPKFRAQEDDAIKVSGIGTDLTKLSDTIHTYVPLCPDDNQVKDYIKHVVTFDFLIENEGNGIYLQVEQHESTPTNFITVVAGEDDDSSTVNVTPNTWNKIALVLDSVGADPYTKYDIILNGETIESGDKGASFGIVENGAKIGLIAPEGETFSAYFDNMEHIGIAEYSMSKKPTVTSSRENVVIEDNAISVAWNVSVADLKAAVATLGTIVNVFNSQGSVLEDNYILNGGEILAAENSIGVNNYYSISLFDNIPDMAFAGNKNLIFKNTNSKVRVSNGKGNFPSNEVSPSAVFSISELKAENHITQPDGTTNNFAKADDPAAALGSAKGNVLHYTYTGTEKTGASNGTNAKAPVYRFDKTVPADTFAYVEWNFDVYFGNADSSVTVGVVTSDTDSTVRGKQRGYASVCASDDIPVYPSSYAAKSVRKTVGVGNWKNVKIKAPISGLFGNIELYIDGKLEATSSTEICPNGLYRFAPAALYVYAEEGKTIDVYIDNINIYLVDPLKENEIRVVGDSVIVDLSYQKLLSELNTGAEEETPVYIPETVGGRIILAAYKDGKMLKSVFSDTAKTINKNGFSELFYDFLASGCDGYTDLKAFYWAMDTSSAVNHLTPYLPIITYTAE